MAFVIRFNFSIASVRFEQIFLTTLLFVGITAVFFLLFKSYISIIRHTNLYDAFRVFAAITSATLLISVIRWADFSFFDVKQIQIPLSVIVIYFLVSFFLLIAFRVFVKYLYIIFFRLNVNINNILIFGAGQLGITTKNTILNGWSSNSKIMGFVDENEGKIGKTIEGIEVFHFNQLTLEFIKRKKIKEIIFAIQKIEPERKKEFITMLMDLGVTVKNVPPVEKWIHGELAAAQIEPIQIEDLLQRAPITLNNPEVKKFITGKVIIITGAAGSIGSELVQQLLLFSPAKLVLIDQAETPLFELRLIINGRAEASLIEIRYIVGDISDKKRMSKVFEENRPQLVFHAAAYKHVPVMEENPYEAVRVNVFGTKVIADLSIESNIEKFVMISTDKAVRPTNVMGASKRLAEMYCQYCANLEANKETKFVTTRFGNVLGSNGSVINIFKDQIESGGPVTITHRDIFRYFMTIPESCQLVLEASTMGNGSDVFLFDMGDPVRITDLAKKMIELAGPEYSKNIGIVFTGLRPGEKLYEELLLSSEDALATHHPKILIAKVDQVPESVMIKTLQRLQYAVDAVDDDMIVAEMKRSLPDFISNNSVYEHLDSKVFINPEKIDTATK